MCYNRSAAVEVAVRVSSPSSSRGGSREPVAGFELMVHDP